MKNKMRGVIKTHGKAILQYAVQYHYRSADGEDEVFHRSK